MPVRYCQVCKKLGEQQLIINGHGNLHNILHVKCAIKINIVFELETVLSVRRNESLNQYLLLRFRCAKSNLSHGKRSILQINQI